MAAQPTHIANYEIVKLLGRGGMGSVYLARDPAIDRLVAIKLLREELGDDAEVRERFTREARSAGRLRHPNIVTVFHIGEYEAQPYIVMEYIPGDTLADIIKKRAPLSITLRLRLLEDVCSGLAYAHKNGIVHRDIKPANILIDADETVKILDFGIARLGDTVLTRLGTVLGTPNYMAPEQIDPGVADLRSDIFSVGLVLYELVTYQRAFPGESLSVMHRVMTAQPEPMETLLPGIDPGLVAIVMRAIEKKPDARYRDLGVMRADLIRVRDRLQASELVRAEAETQVTPPILEAAETLAVPDSQRARRDAEAEAARQAEIARQAAEARERALVALLDQARAQAADGHYDQAIDLLAEQSDEPRVVAAHDEILRQQADALGREARRRRQEYSTLVGTELAAARSAAEGGRFDDALTRLAQIRFDIADLGSAELAQQQAAAAELAAAWRVEADRQRRLRAREEEAAVAATVVVPTHRPAPPPAPTPSPKAAFTIRPVYWAAGIVVVGIVAGAIWWVGQLPQPTDSSTRAAPVTLAPPVSPRPTSEVSPPPTMIETAPVSPSPTSPPPTSPPLTLPPRTSAPAQPPRTSPPAPPPPTSPPPTPPPTSPPTTLPATSPPPTLAPTPPPTVAPVSPPTTLPAATPRPDPATQDRAAIEVALRQFVDAYQSLDVAAVRRIWPTAPANLSFSNMRSYKLEIVGPQISVTGDTARVTCVRQITVQMTAGRDQSASPRTVIAFQRSPTGWIITSVQ